MKIIFKICLVALFLLHNSKSFSQNTIALQALNGQTINPITTAVPFLTIGPDSKQGAMGDAGAATDPDVNSIHWNCSKLAFMDKNKFGAGFTVTPWLRNLVPDINLYYLSGYYKVRKNTTIGSSLRYFSLGKIDLTDINGVSIGSYNPNEFAIDVAASQKLSKVFSMGVALRYINSGIGRFTGSGNQGKAAQTAAVDVTMYYKSPVFSMGDKKGYATGGLAITNVGNKLSYNGTDKNFLPQNMRLGGGLKTIIDEYNTFGVYVDANKLLVPTPPIYNRDANGNIIINPSTGGKEIAAGMDPNVPVTQGIFQSFYDAPGGAKEELKEINIASGIEYSYNNVFAIRAGYFHEDRTKGSRQYITLGAGLSYSKVTIDMSYLIPTVINNPLQNTFRFSLSFNFPEAKKGDAPTDGSAPQP
ncbi:MAG: type IX secretion system outer membrane channel protein PorV [Bacteroidetes bacterium]|nr:type IX secretion system outer membrane channel protein PorV [Bacteroidota bacterium]